MFYHADKISVGNLEIFIFKGKLLTEKKNTYSRKEMEGEIRERQRQALREIILGNFEWERSIFKTVGLTIKIRTLLSLDRRKEIKPKNILM